LNHSTRQPVRTCVGCGQKAEQRELVRLKAEGERVVLDPSRSGGRGAWLHPALSCLERADKRRVFARVLRAEGVRADVAALRVGLTGSARKD
jgi:predicted RNA-binding protein YlxR (DUF448 family)